MLVDVDMCKTVLIVGESTGYEFTAAIFIELLKFFCEVLPIIFRRCMRMSGDVSGAQLAEKRGEGLPYPFLKIEKIAQIIWKNALIVFIHRLNFYLCSNSKCYFKSI